MCSVSPGSFAIIFTCSLVLILFNILCYFLRCARAPSWPGANCFFFSYVLSCYVSVIKIQRLFEPCRFTSSNIMKRTGMVEIIEFKS